MSFSIHHHGGHTGVTGSCHELRLPEGDGILIDCGLFQGDEIPEDRRQRPDDSGFFPSPSSAIHPRTASPVIDFPIAHLKALVVTHVHLDHVGRIPYLLAAGFKGPILCSEPSALLLPLMIEDALKVGVTRDRRLIASALRRLRRQIVPVPYRKWHGAPVGKGDRLDVKLHPAGHILGSAFVECRVRSGEAAEDSRIIFSGDLGAAYAPLLSAPRPPCRADVLVLESTYGNRLHEGRALRRRKLQEVLERALADRGVVLVPAFAFGRTQELLYELEESLHRNRDRLAARGLPWKDLEVIVDSPLAARFTEVYRQLRPYWDAEARRKLSRGRHPLCFDQLTTVNSHADHENAVRYLRKTGRPCIVIAASGMCSGGRIVNYLKALLGDPRTDVLFVGYQAQGMPGRAIQRHGPRGGWVELEGHRYDIRARVHTISGYSAHADRKNLVDFVRRMRIPPREIRLVHGEAEAREALGRALREGIGSFAA